MTKPIGYWLKELDRRIEEAFEVAAEGVTRREWQVLNGLGPEGPFATGDAVAGLAARGWATPDGTLTGAGEAARDRIRSTVDGIRARSMRGIPEADYATTVRTLETMAANLSA
ncbi:hypothetical protein ACFFX1_12090 [Dactylosporangium sucinum]|uniref:MarR family transcriptional regulator n=1 Tax=Dactylosporangium sucinum TaxID=1424081 RepID=A0A917WTT2_9ACTN|nr:MarR family transcriptional regulator [Dactylosporangium sucinum]GGM27367.1 hypothetical protein GCM10007977_030710 [Dactylosporangium sucinum]